MSQDTEVRYQVLVRELERTTGEGLDLQAIIYMIGLQELNFGFRNFTKDEKLDVMHVATCVLLSTFGYYKFKGRDEDGWPHFEVLEKLPPLKGTEQQLFLKEAVLAYFEEN